MSDEIKILARPMYDFIAYCKTCRTPNDFIEIKKSRVLGDIVYAKHRCGAEYKIKQLNNIVDEKGHISKIRIDTAPDNPEWKWISLRDI